jgi:hypothetical protein
MSDTANRRPGFSTLNASAITPFLWAERLITQFEMIAWTELSGTRAACFHASAAHAMLAAGLSRFAQVEEHPGALRRSRDWRQTLPG